MTVAIKEGSKSRQFGNTDYLRTKLVGGGTCDWVREDARQLTKKKVKKDGTYKASDEHDKYGNSYFAFSSFTVAVKKKSITGKKKDPEHPDDPSYDYEVEVAEDEDGNLVEKGVPHHIKIITKPSKLNYRDGEDISIAGIVVKAYEKDGSIWSDENHPNGIIQLSELKFEPKKAKSNWGFANLNTVSIDGYNEEGTLFYRKCYYNTGLNLAPFGWVSVPVTKVYWGADEPWSGKIMFTTYNNKVYAYGVGVEIQEGPHGDWLTACDSHGGGEIDIYSLEAGENYIKDKWGILIDGADTQAPNVPVSTNDPMQEELENADIITVKWNRPQDEKTLTDKYKITITENNAGNGAGGGGGGAW